MRNSCLLILIWLTLFTCNGCAHTSGPVTGIVGGLDHEVAPLVADLTHAKKRVIQGIEFTTGELQGKQVVITTGGFGKVNTAITTTLLIDRFQPDQVLSIGSAGAVNPSLEAGDIVIAERVTYHDLGKYTPEGFVPSPSRNPLASGEKTLFFECDSRLVSRSLRTAGYPETTTENKTEPHTLRVRSGVIVSGDSFIASSDKRTELHQRFDADAVDMESAVVAQVCWQRGIPFIAIRGISDRADDTAKSDYVRNCEVAAINVTELVRRIVNASGGKSG